MMIDSHMGCADLGRLINEYRTSSRVSLDVVFGVLSVLVGFALTVAPIGFALSATLGLADEPSLTSSDYILLSGVGLFLLFTGIFSVCQWYQRRNLRIQVFEHGLLYEKGRSTRLCRWEEIENVKQNIVRLYYFVFPLATTCTYKIQKYDGEILELERFNVDMRHHFVYDDCMRIASGEVRRRAIDAYEAGRGTQAEVARLYGIDLSTFQRWLQRYRQSGRAEPLARGHNPAALDKAQMHQLDALVKETPDATLEQLRDALGVSCSVVAIHNALKRLGYRYKKNAAGQRTRSR